MDYNQFIERTREEQKDRQVKRVDKDWKDLTDEQKKGD